MSPGLQSFTFWFVIGCWIVFVLSFVFRKKAAAKERKRAPVSSLGLLLQSISYVLIWSFRRLPGTPISTFSASIQIALAGVTVLLSAGSVWIAIAAVRALGKQWSVAARVVEGHELITRGPYRLVRNPIYAAMLGMLLATGLVVSHWLPLAIAVVLFLTGTVIRIRAEEALLRESFGAEFEQYADRVSALIPGVY